jgi:hypothetical protein
MAGGISTVSAALGLQGQDAFGGSTYQRVKSGSSKCVRMVRTPAFALGLGPIALGYKSKTDTTRMQSGSKAPAKLLLRRNDQAIEPLQR